MKITDERKPIKNKSLKIISVSLSSCLNGELFVITKFNEVSDPYIRLTGKSGKSLCFNLKTNEVALLNDDTIITKLVAYIKSEALDKENFYFIDHLDDGEIFTFYHNTDPRYEMNLIDPTHRFLKIYSLENSTIVFDTIYQRLISVPCTCPFKVNRFDSEVIINENFSLII